MATCVLELNFVFDLEFIFVLACLMVLAHCCAMAPKCRLGLHAMLKAESSSVVLSRTRSQSCAGSFMNQTTSPINVVFQCSLLCVANDDVVRVTRCASAHLDQLPSATTGVYQMN